MTIKKPTAKLFFYKTDEHPRIMLASYHTTNSNLSFGHWLLMKVSNNASYLKLLGSKERIIRRLKLRLWSQLKFRSGLKFRRSELKFRIELRWSGR